MDGMIFAAGVGSRLRPLTNDRPKALVKVAGKTLLERVVGRMKEAGVERLVVNVHHFGEQVLEFLAGHDNFGMDIVVSDERGGLLDTGGGVLKARELFHPGAAVLAHNVDILTDLDLQALREWHERQGAYATLVVKRVMADRVLKFDADGCLKGWENKRTGERKIVDDGFYAAGEFGYCGIQVLSADFLRNMVLRGAFSIIDEHLSQAETHPIRAFEHTGFFMDAGTPGAVKDAEKAWKAGRWRDPCDI